MNMNSFGQYLERRLLEDVSKQGQIAKYEKSLKSLSVVQGKLGKEGMDTTDIDRQILQVKDAIDRRKSGTHKWHGGIIRVDQEPINNIAMWKLMGRDGIAFHIPVSDAYGIVKIPINWQTHPSPQKPISKIVEYRQEIFGYTKVNLITYTEHRTVDIVPVRTHKDYSEFYLIKRRSGLWATPGGHIDEGELEAPLIAARRELEQETHAQPLVIRQVPGGWIKEAVTDPQKNPTAEFHSWTLPFIALIDPKFEMQPDDDAIGGGEWFKVGSDLPSLHFSHHKKVLQRACNFLPELLKEFGKH